jgi:serine/threonine protein kinase
MPSWGTTIGNYVVSRKVGSGAMARVYLGEHPEIGKACGHQSACRTISPKMPTWWSRFQIEARAIGLLEHPNIVEMYDFGVLPDGRNYYTMEYLQGETLSQRMKRGNFKVRELYAIVEQICDALYVVHEKGIIHRDMKPSNVFLAKKGMRTVVKILDFGICQNSGFPAQGRRTAHVHRRCLLGTPVFMSPEQALGQNEKISYLCDIYSLGVILYKILTDRFPIDGTSIPEVVTWHLTRDAIPLRSVNPLIPEPLAQVVMRCLAKEPAARYASTSHLWEAFSAACAGLDMEWVIPTSIANDVTISPAQGFSLGTSSAPMLPFRLHRLRSILLLPPADIAAQSYPSFATYPPLPPEIASQSVIAAIVLWGERKGKSGSKVFLFFYVCSAAHSGQLFLVEKLFFSIVMRVRVKIPIRRQEYPCRRRAKVPKTCRLPV